MPDVYKIINDYVQASENKETGRQSELEKEKQARILNAEAVELRIRNVIEPAFESVKNQITDKGFPCEIEIVSKKDGRFSSSEKMFAIGIKILTSNKSNACSGADYSGIQYEGKFDAQEMVKSEWICGSCKPPDEFPPVAICRINSDSVDKDLEMFLKKVFAV